MAAAAADNVFVLDVHGGQTLALLLPSRELALGTTVGLKPLGVTAMSARFLPDGQIVFIDDVLALRRIGPNGPLDWLPPRSANAPLFLSPDGKTLAYLKPIGLPPGEIDPSASGVAVLDLATGVERTLFQVPDITVRLYGWVGNQLLVEVPTWSPATSQTKAAPPTRMLLGLLNVDAATAQAAPTAVAMLPAPAPGTRYPQTSFDQRYLAYESGAGVVVMSLDTSRYAVYPGATDPLWAGTGLTVSRAGDRAPLAWAPADLALATPANGPLPLPVTSAPASSRPLRPASPTGIILYRPVSAATPISAYVDLDRRIGTIADWTGWTGTQWVFGHAYDQHWGTDYAGHHGDPVYASTTGTVIKVVIDCVNTYPNGPGSFGTYVLMDNGPQSDGNSYRTLVGHLMCDGPVPALGAVIDTLPTQLARMDNTGWSSGTHTHLQVYQNGVTVDPYNLHIISDSPPISSIGSVQGVVRDGAGQPAAGATVKLASGGVYQTFVTGPNGAYQFSGVNVGNAGLTAVRGPRWSQSAVNILGGQSLAGPDLNLNQCGGFTTAQDGCPAMNFDSAIYVADVTVPDSGVLTPSQPLVKTWRLRNTGSSTWGAGYQLVFVTGTGTAGGAPAAVDVPPTAPDTLADVSASFTGPADVGVHRAYWRLRNPSGTYFGPMLWAELDVQPAGAGITAFSADPASPSGSGHVQIQASADGVPNFRALRLRIDGSVVAEITTPELSYDWQTTGLDAVEHSLVVEAADQTDTNWIQPQRRGLNYALQAPASAAAALLVAVDQGVLLTVVPLPCCRASRMVIPGFSTGTGNARAPMLGQSSQVNAPTPPALFAPIAASFATPVYLNSRTITFRWSSAAGTASNTLYIGASPSPKDEASPLVRQVLGGDVAAYTVTLANDYATLYWQVTASDGSGTSASGAQRFGIDRVAPVCSVQSLPATTGPNTFTVNWTAPDSPSGAATYDVQFLDSGRGVWRDWLRGVLGTSAAFSGQPGHRYGFRCRAMDHAGNAGSYPVAADTATLVGTQSGQADLRVASLSVTPNPTGGALAQVTVINDSGVATQRGFYVDLYQDHVPAGVGDFTGVVWTWVSDPLAAGATITFSAAVGPGGVDHTVTLYAQVDSTGAVDDSNRGNNVWATAATTCAAGTDAYEADASLVTAKLLATGASQDRHFGGPGDRDWMLLDVQPGRFYQFSTSNLTAGVDTRLAIYDANGAGPLASNDDANSSTLASLLGWSPPAAGTFYLVADDWNPAAGGCGAGYTVSAQDVGPGFVTFLPLLIH